MGHFCEKIRLENVSASHNVGNRKKILGVEKMITNQSSPP
jgi:hypothetical protein